MSKRSSRIPGFFKKTQRERLAAVAAFADLTDAELAMLRGEDATAEERLESVEHMIENVVGVYHLPIGFATNFQIDGNDVLVPMVIEECSVVAAASKAARLLRDSADGLGIVTAATAPVMIGQLQIVGIPNFAAAKPAVEAIAQELVDAANASQPRLVSRGGGCRKVEVRELVDPVRDVEMLVVHVNVDVRDAMGANLVNQICETLAPRVAEATGGEVLLRILSNYADRRRVFAVGRVPIERLDHPHLGLDGAEVARRIELASKFAEVDPYRAATHNKGVLNGIDAFLLATGQDWRAVEAGAHAWASRSGRYSALATWRHDTQANELVGRIELPIQVGTVGGVIRHHPAARVLMRVLGAQGASEVGRIAAAVGLAQNLAAILALATEGIQRGHMALHARKQMPQEQKQTA